MEPAQIDDELDLRHYLDVVNRRRIPLAATAILVVVVAMALTFAQTPRYAASAEVLLRSSFSEEILTTNGPVQNNSTLIQINVATEIEYMESRSVETAVIDALGYKPAVSIRSNGETEVVTIRASNEEPELAAEAANTYARTYIDTRRNQLVEEYAAAAEKVELQIADLSAQLEELEAPMEALIALMDGADDATRDSLERDLADLEADLGPQREALISRLNRAKDQLSNLDLSASSVETGGAQLISGAVVPTDPYAPTPLRNGVVAVVVGLILGVGIAFLLETLDTKIRSRADLERITGWPAVGIIPDVTDWKQRTEAHLMSVEDPTSPVAEAYRTLRTSVQFIGLDRQLRSIVVTSSSASEGKTTTLSNLAVTLAKTGKRVIIVDCDLRQPRLHEFFGMTNELGFTSVLLGEAELHDVARPTQLERNLAVLPAGPIPPNPSEMLSLNRTHHLIEQLTEQCDYLLLDAPPILPVSDAAILSRYVDGVLVVVDAKSTRQNEIARAAEMLTQIGAPVLGTVINAVAKQGGGYGYGYGYGYYGSKYGYAGKGYDDQTAESFFASSKGAQTSLDVDAMVDADRGER